MEQAMASIRISVRLDARTGQRLREVAKAAGKNESQIVREALSIYLARPNREESALDLARRSGILGCSKRLPSDLSTNKKYFEGFGR
jgi:metal-responsive CopG/Arc/MetJ family transcriptional regulator